MKSESQKELHIRQQNTKAFQQNGFSNESKVAKVLLMKENTHNSSKRSSIKQIIKSNGKSPISPQGRRDNKTLSEFELKTLPQEQSHHIIKQSQMDDKEKKQGLTQNSINRDEVEMDDRLSMSLSVNFNIRNTKLKVFEAFAQINFLKQHEQSHMSVTRADLCKRQVFFYWYSVLPELKQQNDERLQFGKYIGLCLEKQLKKQVFFQIQNFIPEKRVTYKSDQSQEVINIDKTDRAEEHDLNELMWNKVNSWLSNVPKPSEQKILKVENSTKSILKKKR